MNPTEVAGSSVADKSLLLPIIKHVGTKVVFMHKAARVALRSVQSAELVQLSRALLRFKY